MKAPGSDTLNAFNLPVQSYTYILKLLDKDVAFRKKLQLWISEINEDGDQHCPHYTNTWHVIKSLFAKTCCPFSRKTYQSSLSISQNALTKTMSRNLRESKILYMLQFYQNLYGLIELSCDKSLGTKFASSYLVKI